jgi:hypothetical protein
MCICVRHCFVATDMYYELLIGKVHDYVTTAYLNFNLLFFCLRICFNVRKGAGYTTWNINAPTSGTSTPCVCIRQRKCIRCAGMVLPETTQVMKGYRC